jgi:hypothetical protein
MCSFEDALAHAGRDGSDLPTITIAAARAQAHPKSPKQQWRVVSAFKTFSQAEAELFREFTRPRARLEPLPSE